MTLPSRLRQFRRYASRFAHHASQNAASGPFQHLARSCQARSPLHDFSNRVFHDGLDDLPTIFLPSCECLGELTSLFSGNLSR